MIEMESLKQPDLNSLIADYLHNKGYAQSLKWFTGEVRNDSCLDNSSIMRTQTMEELMNSFDHGNRVEFFSLWNRVISVMGPENLEYLQKLEFYLMVYFAIFPIHPLNSNRGDAELLNKEMQIFKTFIESQGPQLSKTPEFLAFYALPYIKDIQVSVYYK